MKNRLTFLMILLIMAGMDSFSQSYSILAKQAGGKEWGYANLQGEFFIAPQYRDCIGFSEDGLAAIYDSKKKQFYFINLQGEMLQTEVTGFKLIEIFGFGMKGFNDGFAPVRVNDKWGYVNTEGKLAVAASFEKIVPFNDGFGSGQREGKFFIIDQNGNEIPVDIPGVIDVNEFSGPLASFKTSGDLVGFLDGSGKAVIEARFKSAGDFSGGMAWAKDATGMAGFIGENGEWIIPPKFDAAKNMDPETGLARVKMGGSWAYTNKKGDLFFMKDTDIWEDFFNGLARGKKDGLFGYYNAAMEWVIEPQFDGARDFKNGYATVRKGDLWGIIDTSGQWVLEPKFDDAKDVMVVK